jgi:hypothetical protein
MPGENNGLELRRKLIADTPELKIIYTSGLQFRAIRQRLDLIEGQKLSAEAYLTSTLIEILQSVLDGNWCRISNVRKREVAKKPLPSGTIAFRPPE